MDLKNWSTFAGGEWSIVELAQCFPITLLYETAKIFCENANFVIITSDWKPENDVNKPKKSKHENWNWLTSLVSPIEMFSNIDCM